jgi:hypothetical protein
VARLQDAPVARQDRRHRQRRPDARRHSAETFDYRLGNRSALEWVIDQYQVSTDKRSGITSDPNRPDDPEYIARLVGRVVTVSVETVRIVANLPALDESEHGVPFARRSTTLTQNQRTFLMAIAEPTTTNPSPTGADQSTHTESPFHALAQRLRADSIRCTTAAGSGHPSSAMSAADLMAVLLQNHLRYDWQNPKRPDNDHLIFSKGHACPLLYAMYKAVGVVSDEELLTLREFGSRLEGHPTPEIPYVDAATVRSARACPSASASRLPASIWTNCPTKSGCSRRLGDGRRLGLGSVRTGLALQPGQPDRHRGREPAWVSAAKPCSATTPKFTPTAPAPLAGTPSSLTATIASRLTAPTPRRAPTAASR